MELKRKVCHGQQVQLNLVFWKLLIRRKKVRIMETMEKLRVDRARVKFGSNSELKGDSRNRGFQKSGFYRIYDFFQGRFI